MRARVIVALIIAVAVLVPLVPFVRYAHDQPQWATCDQHLRRLGFAVLQYELDHNGKLPDADKWVDEVYPYVKDWRVFRCPADKTVGRSSYPMNDHFSGKRADDITPSHTILIYEASHAGQNPHGNESDMVSPPRHPYPKPGAAYRFNGFVFTDGRVRFPETGEDEKLYHW